MIEQELAKLALFRNVPQDTVKHLADHCTVLERSSGENLYSGTSSDLPSVFLILAGTVEVLHPGANGTLVPVGQIEAGGLAGEFNAIDGHRGNNTVRAKTTTRIVAIPRDLFRSLVEQHASVAIHMCRDLVGVIRGMNDRLASLHGTHSEFDRIRSDLFQFLV